MKTSTWGGVVMGLVLVIPSVGTAQQTVAEAQVADLKQMQEKFTSLAEAFPEDTYDWRPMEGVRSVKEVMALIAAECNLFPGMFGMERSPDAAEGFRPEMERLTAMSRTELIKEIDQSFTHFIGQVEGLDDAARSQPADWFGTEVEVGAGIAIAAGDMHEHLGQAIAYARTNHIVPPWSAGGEGT